MELSVEQILRKCMLFRGLNDKALKLAAEIGNIRHYPAQQVVLRQGEESPGLFCVGDGCVRVYKIAPNGKEHVLHFARSGQTFAEVAVIGGFNAPAFAETVEPTVCALLPTDRFRRLLETNHDFCHQFTVGMAFWVRTLVGLLEDLVLRDATSRVAQFVLRSAPDASGSAFELPVMKKDLASHLNLTRETLSRTLRRLEEAGLIEMPDQHRVRIVSHAALQDVVDGLPPGEFA